MKFDFHVHSRFSPDSGSEVRAILRRALDLGLDLLAITDHDSDAAAFDWLVEEGCISREGRLSSHFAAEAGHPGTMFRLLPGQEISTATGHLLCIAARLEPCRGIAAEEALAQIHRQGGWGIAAHPFDHWRAAFLLEELESLPLDAVEVFNGGATNSAVNQRAFEFATQHHRSAVGGSDAHTVAELGRAFTHAANFSATPYSAWTKASLQAVGHSFDSRVAILHPTGVTTAPSATSH